MGKNNKKKEKARKHKREASSAPDAELLRLRAEVEELKARLERIAELARIPAPSARQETDEDDTEYEEMSRDVDDEISHDEEAAAKPH